MSTKSTFLENEELWKSVVGELEVTISSTYFNMFFPKTKITRVDQSKKIIEILCPNVSCKNNIETRYSNQIRNIIKTRTDVDYTILLTAEDSEKPLKENSTPLFNTEAINEENNHKQSVSVNTNTKQNHIGLIHDYKFENFIVGPNNRLAYTVAKAAADNPGRAYNPYLVYSDVGLGKTHLLQAIGNEVAKTKPHLKILYCTGQEFLNELMEELQTYRNRGGTLAKFKNKFTSVDVWLIDDVQHIAGRDTSQEEFYFAFNTLYLNKKQIVLSTDKHPSEIAKLENRISSRFNMGMIADMQMPDVDVRNAILRGKRDEMGSDVGNETIDFIAQNISTNIRELEGAFIQVITVAKSENRTADVQLAQEVLSKSVVLTNERNVRPTRVIQEVAKFYNCEIREIKGKRRTKDIVLPRHVAMFLLKEINQMPLMDIGVTLGGRDHTTVIHGADRIEKEIGNGNYRLKKEVSQIKENILTTSLG